MHTVGHGTLTVEAFSQVLDDAGVRLVVDVRSFPGSRRNPQFGREAMERWLPAQAFGYHWLGALGGRRRPVSDSKHVALRHPSFRAYADHMGTPEFLAGVDELLGLAETEASVVMCSESVWWRCHRRLLADHLQLVRGLQVLHLMHDGRVTPHKATDGVRRTDGGLTYDLGVTQPLSLGPAPPAADSMSSGAPGQGRCMPTS